MTPTELAQIRVRCEAATPGPWVQRGNSVEPHNSHLVSFKVYGSVKEMDDTCRFIANARQDVPKLLAEVERLRAALSVIAENTVTEDNDQWGVISTSPMVQEIVRLRFKHCIEIARKALREECQKPKQP